MSKNIFIKNNINKKYLNNNLYKQNKIKLDKILESIFTTLESRKDAFHILNEKFKLNFDKDELKKFSNYKSVIVIGMGGSTLGAQAIYTFLKQTINKVFIFLDNLEQEKIEKIKTKNYLKNSLFIIISKSGNTLETLINSNLLKDKINHRNSIIITGKKNNILNIFAKEKKILHIDHKDYIGGRYSVLSEAGMLPAYFMGLKINFFRKNLLDFFKAKEKLLLVDSVAKLAHIYNLKKINSIILINYAPELNEFLFWCQQLMAESLGKQGKGIMPVVSPTPRDHHSLLQLYLDGPKDKLFYIFSLKLTKSIKTNNNIFDKKFRFAENKKLSKIKEAQKKALIQAFKNRNISYREFIINKKAEESIGELFAYFMLETALIGNIIGIDPFNQPAVEEVKILTKQYLS